MIPTIPLQEQFLSSLKRLEGAGEKAMELSSRAG